MSLTNIRTAIMTTVIILFVFDVMFPMQGTIAGFGFIDVGKQPQEYIDKMDAEYSKMY